MRPSSGLLRQVGFVARRSVQRSLRQPAVIMPTIVFPLVLMAVTAAGLEEATRLPGFPTDNYLDFAVVATFIQGALFATTTAGTELAHDMETGFLDRLALTPLQRVAILLGQLAGAVSVGMIGTVFYLAVGLVFGVTFEAGPGGVLVILALSFLICVGFGAIGSMMALATGSGEAVQGLFPLMFVLFFLSSVNLPRDLIEVEWFRAIATANPISYLVEGLRSVIVVGWDAEALALGFLTAAGIIAVAFAGANSMMRRRVART